MKTKIAKVRQYVHDNRTYLAFCAGSVTTSTVIYALTKDKTLLQVTPFQHQLLDQGGAIVYQLKDQTLHLVNIDAVKAVQSVTQ